MCVQSEGAMRCNQLLIILHILVGHLEYYHVVGKWHYYFKYRVDSSVWDWCMHYRTIL